MCEYLLSYICDIKMIFLFVVIYLIYKLEKLNQNLDKKIGHKGPPPLPFFGNLLDVLKVGFHEFDKVCLQKYGKIYPFYLGRIKTVVVSDEELLKQILIKEFKCFMGHLDVGFRFKHSEKMLVVLEGKDWERVRNFISPTFTSGKLRKMSPLISDGIDLLKKRISEHPLEKPIDFKEFFGALTMDIIARTMFGLKIDSQTNSNNLFVINAKKLFIILMEDNLMIIYFMFPKLEVILRKLFSYWEFSGANTIQFFIDSMQKVIDQRKISGEKYNDFLGLMLKAQKDGSKDLNPESSKSLTNEEITSQSLIFLLAGYETTATTLTYIAYFLAKDQTAQNELYDEILNTIGNEGEISYEVLINMRILDEVVSETLRICPPVVRNDRVCTQDVTLMGSDNSKKYVKKGDIFVIPIYAIHTDPSIWPDPETFDYHRFDPENKKTRSQYSYMPFGIGPRNCIGMRFALLETKWAIVNILQKYKIIVCNETMEKIKFKTTGLSNPEKPILLKIVNRN